MSIDVDGFRAMTGLVKMDSETVILAIHKARIEVTDIPLPMRLESVEWLRARSYTRLHGIPLPPPGVEPL